MKNPRYIINQINVYGLLLSFLFFAMPGPMASAWQSPRRFTMEERYCMAQNIFFEARGEPLAGQFAVSFTVINRFLNPYYNPDGVKGNLCDIVTDGYKQGRRACQFSWYCDGKSDRPEKYIVKACRSAMTAKRCEKDDYGNCLSAREDANCKASDDYLAWESAKQISDYLLKDPESSVIDPTGSSLYYVHCDVKNKRAVRKWLKKKTATEVIGDHCFYTNKDYFEPDTASREIRRQEVTNIIPIDIDMSYPALQFEADGGRLEEETLSINGQPFRMYKLFPGQ